MSRAFFCLFVGLVAPAVLAAPPAAAEPAHGTQVVLRGGQDEWIAQFWPLDDKMHVTRNFHQMDRGAFSKETAAKVGLRALEAVGMGGCRVARVGPYPVNSPTPGLWEVYYSC